MNTDYQLQLIMEAFAVYQEFIRENVGEPINVEDAVQLAQLEAAVFGALKGSEGE